MGTRTLRLRFVLDLSFPITAVSRLREKQQPIGKVKEILEKYIVIDSNEKISNGDGLCYVSENQILEGFRVNRADGYKLFPLEMPLLKIGTPLFRNHDQLFENALTIQQTVRKITVSMILVETDCGISLMLIDEDNYQVNFDIELNKVLAENSEKSIQSIKQALSKTGNTIFETKDVQIQFKQSLFIQSSVINDLRRNALQKLENERLKHHIRIETPIIPNNYPYPEKEITYLGNVVNKYSRIFYEKHGAKVLELGLELQKNTDNKILMSTRYCLRFEMGCCPKENSHNANEWKNPFYLENNKTKLQLDFDCKQCLMHVKLAK